MEETAGSCIICLNHKHLDSGPSRNFEESEDELREAVADSMKNLFVMEDGSSDEAGNTEEDGEEVHGGTQDRDNTGEANAQQNKAGPEDPTGGDGERDESQTDEETSQQQTS